MLDPRLHTFLVLCETMNYTRAAERLCLTQPAVSHQIRSLEVYYGHRLFSYRGKALRLTPEGETLRDLARPLAYNSRKIRETLSIPPRSPCGWELPKPSGPTWLPPWWPAFSGGIPTPHCL